MKNITYLIGAGASANAVPIVKDMKDDIKEVAEKIKTIYLLSNEEPFHLYTPNNRTQHSRTSQRTYQLKLIEALEWLINEGKNYESIDALAKKLYDNEEKSNLEKLKMVFSIYLVIKQTMGEIDNRYDIFFNNIIVKPATFTDYPVLPKQLKIISWNYDYQFEKAYSKYYEKTRIDDLWNALNVIAKHLPKENTSEDSFSIYKLNGTEGIIGKHPLNREGKHYATHVTSAFDEKLLQEVIRSYATCIDEKHNFYSTLSFAFEKELSHQKSMVTKTIEGISNTEILIVIGYSFPSFNEEIDTVIINSMGNLEEVYFQAPDAELLQERFLKIRPSIKNHQIEVHTNIDYFLCH